MPEFRSLPWHFVDQKPINSYFGKQWRHGRIQRRDRGSRPPPPPGKSQKHRVLSNTGPDPLKNYKPTKPAFNVGPSSARQRNAILMAFCWRADDGPLKVVFWSFLPSSTKREKTLSKCQIWTPSDKTFCIRAWKTQMKCRVMRHSIRSVLLDERRKKSPIFRGGGGG